MEAAQTREWRAQAQAQEIIVASGISAPLWWLYGMMWLLCVVPGLRFLAQVHPAPGRWLLSLAALVPFVTVYAWVMWPHPLSRRVHTRSRSLVSGLVVTLLTGLALGLSLVGDHAFFWLFVCVSATAGVMLPTRSAVVVVVILMILTALVGAAGAEANWPQVVLPLVLLVRGLGLDMIGLVRLFSALQELQTARKELARLAIVEERERLSRDLHDLLGQTLSMITLKSELARHLVTENPERCSHELSEIERVARQTLREVREAVADYRQPRFESELEGARQLLETAGINAQIDPIPEILPAAVDAVLAWTVREGVTNIIRHSRARQCRIRLTHKNGIVRAEVLSDGSRREQAKSPGRSGLGLAGLRERVSTLGGRMEAGPLTLSGKEHFRVYVELPMKSDVEALILQEE